MSAEANWISAGMRTAALERVRCGRSEEHPQGFRSAPFHGDVNLDSFETPRAPHAWLYPHPVRKSFQR